MDYEDTKEYRNTFIRALMGIPPKKPKERKHNDNKKDTKQQIKKTLERPRRDTDKR